MAIQTKEVGTHCDTDDTSATLSYDYDDQDLRVRLLRCVNNTSKGCWIKASRAGRSRTYERTAPANQTSTQTNATTQANRLQLFVDSRGRLDGVEWAMGLVA